MQEAVQPWLAPHLARIVNQLNTKNWAKVTVKLPNGVLVMRTFHVNGNFRIAVQWYERVVGDSGSRLDFRPGEPGKSYFCSTELRLVGARVERTGLATLGCSLTLPAPPSPVSPSSSSSSLPASCSAAATHSEEKEAEEQDLDGDDEVSIWRLHMPDEAAGLAFCR